MDKTVRKIVEVKPKPIAKLNPERVSRADRIALMRSAGLTNFSGRQWRKFREAQRRNHS